MDEVIFHIKEYYLVIRRNTVLFHATTWTNLEYMLSERSQIQKPTYSMILFIQNVRIDKSIETIDEWWFRAGAGGRRKRRKGLSTGMGFLFGVIKMF